MEPTPGEKKNTRPERKMEERQKRAEFRISIFGPSSEKKVEGIKGAAETATLLADKGEFQIVTGGENAGVMKAVHNKALEIAKSREEGAPNIEPIGVWPGKPGPFGRPLAAVKGGKLEYVENIDKRRVRLIDGSDVLMAFTSSHGTDAEVMAALFRPERREKGTPIILFDPSGELQMKVAKTLKASGAEVAPVYVVETAEEGYRIAEIYFARKQNVLPRSDEKKFLQRKLMKVEEWAEKVTPQKAS